MRKAVFTVEAQIHEKLNQIETREGCRVLLAVESGSRAWGFASPDSDYDVRFLYIRPREAYLRLEGIRDVIELPVGPVLDINGWDMAKALRLLHKSNPTLLEWLASPIVYRGGEFAERLRPLAEKYFSPQSSLHHYLHMAEGNYRTYLRGDTVPAKKYFYVLRPLLACLWILDRGTPPTVPFGELMESQPDAALQTPVERLLALKVKAPELREIPRVDALNEWLECSMGEIRRRIESLPPVAPRSWEELNALFLSLLDS